MLPFASVVFRNVLIASLSMYMQAAAPARGSGLLPALQSLSLAEDESNYSRSVQRDSVLNHWYLRFFF